MSAGPAESEPTSCFEVKARRIALVDGFPSSGGGGGGGAIRVVNFPAG